MTPPRIDISATVNSHADAFKQEWMAGRRPDIAQTLTIAPPEVRTPLLEECLMLDLAYRVQQGESPRFEEYEQKYPDLQALIGPLREIWDQTLTRLQPHPPARKPEVRKHPRKIRRYVITETLPTSGQAELFRAMDPELRREVIIK